jgi:hypothetical protein
MLERRELDQANALAIGKQAVGFGIYGKDGCTTQ